MMISQLKSRFRHELSRMWRMGIVHIAASLAFVQGASLISQFLLANVFTPENYAIVKISENSLRLLIIPAMAGIPTAVVRYVADENDPIRQRILLKQAVFWSLIIALIVSTLMFLFAPLALADLEASHYLRLLVWSVPLTSCSRTIIAYFQGLKEIKRLAIYNSFAAIFSVLTTVIGGYFFGLDGWAFGRFLGEILILSVVLFPVMPILRAHVSMAGSSQLLTFGGVAFFALLLDRFVQMSDVIILTRLFISQEDIGIYGLATTLLTALYLPIGAVMYAVFPMIAEQASKINAWILVKRLLVRVVGIATLIMLSVLGLGWYFIPLFWGKSYAAAAQYLNILMPLFILNSLLTVLGTFVFGIGRPIISVIMNGIGVLFFIPTAFMLTVRLGVFGIIMSITATSLLRLFVLSLLIRRELNIGTPSVVGVG